MQLMKYEDKPLLVRLLELYFYEFTRYDSEDISEYGYYGYSHIDDYWNEEGRFPYLIRVDGKIAGFALVCPYCRHVVGEDSRSIGEFFVMIKYRRKGVGQYAAKWVFDRHPGKWEVCYLPNNAPAEEFWTGVIGEYTRGRYDTFDTEDDMKGFAFDNR